VLEGWSYGELGLVVVWSRENESDEGAITVQTRRVWMFASIALAMMLSAQSLYMREIREALAKLEQSVKKNEARVDECPHHNHSRGN